MCMLNADIFNQLCGLPVIMNDLVNKKYKWLNKWMNEGMDGCMIEWMNG